MGNQFNFDLISKYMYYQFSALKTEFEDKYKYIIEENEKLKENCLKLEKEIENIKEDNKVIKSAYHLIKEENQKIIKENNEMKNKIQKLEKNIYEEKNEINNINTNDNNKILSIKEEDKFNFIKQSIEEKINKKIHDIKKLYQATIDGGDAEIFHKKCDNIPNTLVLIESKGNRKFGGFASECWGKFKRDKNCFLFSRDKNKI